MSSAVTTQVTELQNYINGAWRRPSSTEFFDVTNPATTETSGSYADVFAC